MSSESFLVSMAYWNVEADRGGLRDEVKKSGVLRPY